MTKIVYTTNSPAITPTSKSNSTQHNSNFGSKLSAVNKHVGHNLCVQLYRRLHTVLVRRWTVMFTNIAQMSRRH